MSGLLQERKASLLKNSKQIKNKTFFGHPASTGVLCITNLCNAFASYGMSSILIYYLYAAKANGGLAFSQTNAAQLVALYTSLSIMIGILGSFVADRILGVRKSLLYSRIVATAAYGILAWPGSGIGGYLISQILLLLSFALAGRSADALLGKLYEKGDIRRDSAYTISYIITNVGAIAPFLSGTVALIFSYKTGFWFSFLFSMLGTLFYIIFHKKYFGKTGLKPDDPLKLNIGKKLIGYSAAVILTAIVIVIILLKKKLINPTSFSNLIGAVSIFIPIVYFGYIINCRKTGKQEAAKVKALIPLFIANCFSMFVYMHSTSVLAIYAAERTDLRIGGFTITPAAFQSVAAILAIVWGTLVNVLWHRLRKRQPSSPVKIGIGTILWGLGPIFMAVPLMKYGIDVKVSPLWLVVYYMITVLGEAVSNPVGYSTAYKVAPKAFTVQMMSVWSLSQSTGAGLGTMAVNFYRPGREAFYMITIGLITCSIGIMVLLSSKKLQTVIIKE